MSLDTIQTSNSNMPKDELSLSPNPVVDVNERKPMDDGKWMSLGEATQRNSVWKKIEMRSFNQ